MSRQYLTEYNVIYLYYSDQNTPGISDKFALWRLQYSDMHTLKYVFSRVCINTCAQKSYRIVISSGCHT